MAGLTEPFIKPAINPTSKTLAKNHNYENTLSHYLFASLPELPATFTEKHSNHVLAAADGLYHSISPVPQRSGVYHLSSLRMLTSKVICFKKVRYIKEKLTDLGSTTVATAPGLGLSPLIAQCAEAAPRTGMVDRLHDRAIKNHGIKA